MSFECTAIDNDNDNDDDDADDLKDEVERLASCGQALQNE
jgi:hypothetical protein